MNCRQADKWIDRALDEALHPAQKAHLEAHLEGCPRCRREWEVLRAADVALRAPRPVRAPEGMLAEFRQRVAQEEAHRELRQAPRRAAWPWFWPVASFAAAGAAAVVVLGFNLVPGRETSPGPAPAPPEVMAKSPARDPEITGPAPLSVPAPAAPEALSGALRQKPPGNSAKSTDAMAATPLALRTPTLPTTEARSTAGGPRRPVVRNNAGVSLNVHPRAAAAPKPADAFRDDARIAGAERPVPRLFVQPNPIAAGAPPAGPGAGPVALEADVLDVRAAVLPPEFNVSPAVLTALRRDVEVNVETLPVREALKQITEAADVVVRVDDSVQPLRVTVAQDGAPLWVALESVARQGRLQIVAEENQLVLRPAVKAGERKLESRAPAPARNVKRAAEPAPAGGQPTPFALKPSLPAPPAAPAARGEIVAVPDRAIWPSTWGTLPERGFQPPAPEELPPSVGNLPQAMDEARESNRSYYLNNQLYNQKAKQADVKREDGKREDGKRDGRKAP